MIFKKLILFLVILLVAEQLFKYVVINKLPKFWGNEEIYNKAKFVKNEKEINTVFIGSSKIKAQIIPQIFDSVNIERHIKSFNLGCNALFIPESFQLATYIIDSTNVSNIIYEVRPVMHIYPQNLHITRTIYYHTLSNFYSTIKNAYNSNLPFSRKSYVYATYFIANIESLLNFNFYSGYISFKNFSSAKDDTLYKSSLGYKTMGCGTSKELLNDSSELKSRANNSIQYMQQFKEGKLSSHYNKAYLQQLNALIEKAKNKKKQLYFILPSAVKDYEFAEVLPILQNLKMVPQIIMSDASNYPEFYLVKNNYELEHFNLEGSKLFSNKIANEYKRINLTLNK